MSLQLTLRWREWDSNHRSRVTRPSFSTPAHVTCLTPCTRKVGANENRYYEDAGRLPRNRWFEFIFLQRRVCKLSVPERRTHRLENSGAYATERGMPDMAFSLYSSPGARPSHFRSVRTVVRTQPAARSPSALDGAGDHPSLLVDLRRRRSCLGAI